ncbi:MAG: glutamate 5-kinase [Candidatus Omnitrophica bacterium]|nr:glutamate 5-kinase [Candidatus Omnitrophota bacterium]
MLKTLNLKTIVIKIGTKVLASDKYCLDKRRIERLAEQINSIVKKGINVVVVSSGAICSGMGLLGFKHRPSSLAELQACAAAGQAHLMQTYDDFFRRHGVLTAQVLLTQEDLNDRKRYLNAKATLKTLLKKGAVPIVNENDTISTDEIKFGDNDKLSSLVANLVGADLLVLLSDVEGLYRYENGGKTDRRPISVVDEITREIEQMAQKGTDERGTGGMASKLQAAKIAASSGIPCIIANGKGDTVLTDIIERRSVGTLFLPSSVKMAARKRWLVFGARPKGEIRVDGGAKEALIKGNRSLLSSGIIEISGEFKKGDIVAVAVADSDEFARGIVTYPSGDLKKIKGLKTAEIAKALGYKGPDEIIHRDNLVIL